MKFKQSKDSFSTILKIVIGVVFSLIILAISYKAVTTSSENRSKAAETQFTYKSWEFNGATTEGWLSANLSGVRVAGGLLTAMATGNLATLINKSVGTPLPQGNKYVKLRLAVGNTSVPTPSPFKSPTYQRPVITKGPQPQPVSPFYISINYTNKGTQRVIPSIRGMADGNFHEYSVILPVIAGITIDSVQLMFSLVRTAVPIQLDYVRLVGSPPAPTPSVVCKTGVNSFSVDTPCTGGYEYMTFACYDGLSQREGGPTSCKSSSVWSSYAQEYCKGRSNCSTTITPTGGPIPVTPPPTNPTPTPICVTSCDTKGNCNTICSQPIPTRSPSTPTPTVTPTPSNPVASTATPTTTPTP